MEVTTDRFVRRGNRDSTSDSICTRCLRTVETGKDDQRLTSAEEKHICDAFDEFYMHSIDSQRGTF
jgi:hypothetical protein